MSIFSPQSSDDLYELVRWLDYAITSNNPTVQVAIRNLKTVVDLTYDEEIVDGPLSALLEENENLRESKNITYLNSGFYHDR